MSIYKSIETAKNGTQIPVFQSGKTMESRYNPERDAENICKSLNKNYNFFLVTGIGSGILIKKLSESYPNAKIICFEISEDDVFFLKQLPVIKKLSENKNIFFENLASLPQAILDNYLPAKYGELKIIEQKNWLQENATFIPQIQKTINCAIGLVSADYSVQSHFGKIWQTNIINNLKLMSKMSEDEIAKVNSFSIDEKKTAAIVAAGPSLDKTIAQLKDNNELFIISTDTAYQTLIKNDIRPDVVISIDGQSVSYNHFCTSIISSKTIFAFDLCSNFSAAKYIFNKHGKVSFFISGHPLSSFANIFCGSQFPFLFSGSGTVTISAIDFAVKSGFKNIKIYGADFAYSKGKSYAKGTYLEKLNDFSSDKIKTNEFYYSKLMYRTKLVQKDGMTSTDILNAYKTSMEKYLLERNILFELKNNVYNLKNSFCKKNDCVKSFKFNYSDFIELIKKTAPEQLETPLLPYIAWLRKGIDNNDFAAWKFLNLAYSSIVSYN
ncbi:6-hydroxymethylpterin diphosphokinase MptE-like protein [Treponema sp. Marseille-Q3903]|uniref:6-hydroxymethylpterin diphosphokinase MptE-like protein n=1 Tax=Treponema sp. Marseille-Q3903 TaxID=2766703 RepID=UPI001651FA0D|nr:6-hydroxymethylpterin diphosphokinase MptE-like protein [Treponema sp. Marseille-Q3903]MBC6713715.1 motility associated factor glycosyltransferase family protein [Treponema sp. Marseille-Q3903]